MVEYCYQTKKRHQTFPIAQVVGRTDLALFPVAGYLVRGSPDATALLCFLFFYPWALAHLAANDTPTSQTTVPGEWQRYRSSMA